MPDTLVRVEFLKKIHLFRGLNDDQLKAVAEELQEHTYDEPDTVFVQGMRADSLYIVFQGRVTITRRNNKKEVKVGTLVRGDYFGEQGLVTGHNRNASVKAEKGAILLILYRPQFKLLLRKVSGLRANFEAMMASRQLAGQLSFKWLNENEVIYFLARKHVVLLNRALFLPVALMLPILGVLAVAYFLNSATFAIIGAIAFLLDLAWGVWSYVDWGNDYYIVTNQRVIVLEKVIGLYDSRTEAGMNSILSVSVETDQTGRIFDYGTVVVRTFTGQIRMEYVQSPKQAGAMIEEYWMRTKDTARQSEQEVMKQAIRGKLGLEPAKAVLPAAAPKPPEKKRLQVKEWWRDVFTMRIEEGGIVTYRKHVFILFRNTLIQDVALLLIIAAPFGWSMFSTLLGPLPLWFLALLALAFFFIAITWLYEYADWSNDVYQVTPDQIIDINRKPFGAEDRKAAPLENILSSEYKRRGLLGMILNFGTVYIMVGGAQFNFEDVADPPTVQQDIVRRQQARTHKKREAESAGERERMADWLAMYHRTVDDMRRDQNQSAPEKPE